MAAASDKLPIGRLAVYVFAGGGLTWCIFLAVQLYYFTSVEAMREKRVYENRNRESQILQREQQAELQQLRWVDREKKLVGVPIEKAMQDTLEQWKKN